MMQNPITIVHLSSSLGGGGAEQMVFQLAKQSNPIIKTIVISISELNTLEDIFINENIEVHFLNITSFRNFTLLQGIKELNNILKDYQKPIFHCHQFHGGLLGMLYNLRYKSVPITYTMHTNKVTSKRRRWLLFFTKSFREKDIIFSKNSKRWYLKNSIIIPNGADFKEFDSDRKRYYNCLNPFVFLFLGRLSTPKNPLSLVTFANQLKRDNINNFIIHVVGDGLMRGELEELISKYQLENHIKLFGFAKNIKEFISKAHCLILPSSWEGMPVVIIEAAASNLPIIATPVGSIPDFLNESNSVICDLNSFPKEMKSVMENYEEAKEKAQILHEEIKSVFNIDSVYLKHLKVYQSIL